MNDNDMYIGVGKEGGPFNVSVQSVQHQLSDKEHAYAFSGIAVPSILARASLLRGYSRIYLCVYVINVCVLCSFQPLLYFCPSFPKHH